MGKLIARIKFDKALGPRVAHTLLGDLPLFVESFTFTLSDDSKEIEMSLNDDNKYQGSMAELHGVMIQTQSCINTNTGFSNHMGYDIESAEPMKEDAEPQEQTPCASSNKCGGNCGSC